MRIGGGRGRGGWSARADEGRGGRGGEGGVVGADAACPARAGGRRRGLQLQARGGGRGGRDKGGCNGGRRGGARGRGGQGGGGVGGQGRGRVAGGRRRRRRHCGRTSSAPFFVCCCSGVTRYATALNEKPRPQIARRTRVGPYTWAIPRTTTPPRPHVPVPVDQSGARTAQPSPTGPAPPSTARRFCPCRPPARQSTRRQCHVPPVTCPTSSRRPAAAVRAALLLRRRPIARLALAPARLDER